MKIKLGIISNAEKALQTSNIRANDKHCESEISLYYYYEIVHEVQIQILTQTKSQKWK